MLTLTGISSVGESFKPSILGTSVHSESARLEFKDFSKRFSANLPTRLQVSADLIKIQKHAAFATNLIFTSL